MLDVHQLAAHNAQRSDIANDTIHVTDRVHKVISNLDVSIEAKEAELDDIVRGYKAFTAITAKQQPGSREQTPASI